jgi:AraC family transcriptional regulator
MARAFRASRGCSIGEYISRTQINSAKHLLATRASVKEVSYRLGFSSPANFSTAFHYATGESPRTFQQHNRIT